MLLFEYMRYNVHIHKTTQGVIIMKICFPVSCNDGMESKVFDHFGSAPMFLMVDVKTGEIHEQVNQDKGHGHGQCGGAARRS